MTGIKYISKNQSTNYRKYDLSRSIKTPGGIKTHANEKKYYRKANKKYCSGHDFIIK